MSLPYREGDVFAVTLEDGGYALGVIARVSEEGQIPVGYFFAPRIHELPSARSITLGAKDAIRIFRFGDLHLLDGKWRIICRVESWQRESWPVPKFIREDPILGITWLVTYSDDDPAIELGQEKCDRDLLKSYERAGLSGAGAVEIKLSKVL